MQCQTIAICSYHADTFLSNTIFQNFVMLCENYLEEKLIVYYDLLENNLF